MLLVLLSLVPLDALCASGKLLMSQLYFSLFSLFSLSVSLNVKSAHDLIV